MKNVEYRDRRSFRRLSGVREVYPQIVAAQSYVMQRRLGSRET